MRAPISSVESGSVGGETHPSALDDQIGGNTGRVHHSNLVGVSTEMVQMANQYLSALTPAQRELSHFRFDEGHRTTWDYLPFASSNPRYGVPWPELSIQQRTLAH